MIWLKHFREKCGISQKKLADLIGVQENTVWRWENNKATPSVDAIPTTANALGITESELLNGPAEDEFTVEVKFVKSLEGVTEEMKLGGLVLDVAENGYMGISGMMKFSGPEDIEKAIRKIRVRLEHGLKFQKELAEAEGKLEG